MTKTFVCSAAMEIGSITAVLVTLATNLVVYLLWSNRRPAYLPPGPPHIPFLGSILSFTDEAIPKLFIKWKDIYGPIFTVSFGNVHKVVLSDFKTIKEGLVGMGTQLAGRPDVHGHVSEKMKLYSPIFPTIGIGDNTYSEEWKRQRNVALQILRRLGYGKNTIEERICEESVILRDLLLKQDGAPTDPEQLLTISVSNVICSLLYGSRYEHDDPEFQQLCGIHGQLGRAFFNEGLADCIPLLRLRPAYHRHLAIMKDACKKLNDFNRMKVDERVTAMPAVHDPRDFIEAYIKELKSPSGYKLQENWLIPILADLLFAGTETTASTLQWALLRMALCQDVQFKVQTEMDEVFGHELHGFKLEDREKLPYVMAALMEIQRLYPILPLALPHTTIENVNLCGFNLPAGTEVICNLYAALTDPEVWPQPEKLHPERFIDDDGQIIYHEQWIPFSMGRRMCLGEQLAKQELFLYFSTIMHSFNITLPQGIPPPSLEGKDHGFWKSLPYTVIFSPRLH